MSAPTIRTASLRLQRRLAMELLNVGWRKVWLDPSKIKDIAQARSRAKVRELIATDVIQVIPTYRGIVNKMTKDLQQRHQGVQRFKKAYALKQQNANSNPATAGLAETTPSATSGATTV